MPHIIGFILKRRLVTITAVGSYSADDILAMLTEVIDNPRFVQGMDVLVDFQVGTFAIAPHEVRRILEAMAGPSEALGPHRTAVVVQSTVMHGISRMLASYVDELQLPTTARFFYDRDEALAWLAEPRAATE